MTYQIRRYEEFHDFVLAFANGRLGSTLLVNGSGGISKSYAVKSALKDVPHLFLSGHVTPAEVHKKLFEHRGELVVFDDVDLLLKDRLCIAMLKQLCETSKIKTVQYTSSKSALQGVPQVFRTTSNVLIIGNNLESAREDVRAFLTRGASVHFNPGKEEIFAYLETWARDEVVLSFIRNALGELGHLDLRKYVIAADLRAAGLNWQDFLVSELDIPGQKPFYSGSDGGVVMRGADVQDVVKSLRRRIENDGRERKD